MCGMLTGSGLSQVWRHDRAHRFFSHARWSSQDLGLALAELVVALLVPDGEPVLVAIDDTLFKRTGPKVHAIGWFHDGSAKGPKQVGLGNNWVIARSWSGCRSAPARWRCRSWPGWRTRTSSLLRRPGWSWPGR